MKVIRIVLLGIVWISLLFPFIFFGGYLWGYPTPELVLKKTSLVMIVFAVAIGIYGQMRYLSKMKMVGPPSQNVLGLKPLLPTLWALVGIGWISFGALLIATFLPF